MRQITSFTDDPSQTINLILADGSKIEFGMKYSTNQLGWFYSLTYKSTVIANRRMVASPNLLRAFRGFLPFGIGITVSDGLEPIYIDDFINGRASFFLLDADDVAGVETMITLR